MTGLCSAGSDNVNTSGPVPNERVKLSGRRSRLIDDGKIRDALEDKEPLVREHTERWFELES